MTNPVAKILHFTRNPYPWDHHSRLVITQDGKFTVNFLGCAGEDNDEQKSVASALAGTLATLTLLLGDTIYPKGLSLKGVDLDALSNVHHKNYSLAKAALKKRIEEHIEVIRQYFAKIYCHDQSFTIICNGNHEGACQGLSPDRIIKHVLAKLNAMPAAVTAYNQKKDALKITLEDSTQIPKFDFEHRYHLYEIIRDGASEPEAVVI